MTFRPRFVTIILILLSLYIRQSPSVSAQATEEADPRATVLQAFETIHHESYHFTLASTTVTTYTLKNSQSFTAVGIYSSSGQVAANGDYHDAIVLKTGTTLKGTQNSPAFQMERTVVNGETYLNLPSNLLTYLQLLKVDAGWWHYSDLVRKIDDAQLQMGIDALVNFPMPSIIPIANGNVNNATEDETKTIDNRVLRVYDLELKDMDYLLAQRPGTSIRTLIDALKAQDLLSSVDSSFNTQFLLGADDDRLYRIENESQVLFRDLSTSANSSPNIDQLKIKTTSTYTLDYPDQTVTITLPDSSLLNH
ncbi:MAG: hypothetical protein ABI700_21930 [Chloroflexota bacterium]